ncbi:MAG: hypothetical protein ACLFTT_00675 [Candidatus Hydrogenedentota bacterium]
MAAIRRLGVFALNHGVRVTVNNQSCYDGRRTRMGQMFTSQAQAVAAKHVLLAALGT